MIRRIILVLVVALVVFLLYVFVIRPNFAQPQDVTVVEMTGAERLAQSGLTQVDTMSWSVDMGAFIASGEESSGQLSDKDYEDLESILKDLVK